MSIGPPETRVVENVVAGTSSHSNKPKQDLRYWDRPRHFTPWQRLQVRLIANLAAWSIRIVGRSLRWESHGDEYLDAIYRSGQRAIFTFWHGMIFPATYYWRHRGIVVMTSQNFDGEYIARCISKHGFRAARGSSSRGGLKALSEMAQCLKHGKDVAFTVDGPRGPRHQVKPGPVMLAKRTGAAIFCFHISVRNKIRLRNWDRTEIPVPFSRAVVLKAPPIYVERGTSENEVQSKIGDMQRILDDLCEQGKRYWEN